MWDNDNVNQNSNVPTDAPVETPAQVPVETPVQAPVEAPVQVPVQAPVQPVTNGFSADGSYRYVPPREGQPVQSAYYQPAAPQTPPPAPKKNGRGWVVVVAVLAVLAILISGMSVAFVWVDRETKAAAAEKEKTSQSGKNDKDDDDDEDDDDDKVNENAPTMDQTPGGSDDVTDVYGDGGLSTETIVSKNNDSTVVLEMYMETSNRYFGESSLQQVGSASGIVWTADGYIITNCHCVIDEDTGEEFDRIDVILYNGTVYEGAEVIGADESTDLAVIKVDATDLTPAEFGDSDDLAVGSRVVALGNAAGLSWTATQGIVSAKARDVYDDTGYAIPCLQTDAAINGGNSGGPLLNKYGQVVGINSAKIVASGIEGLGFSIPINEAKEVLESLAKYGYVKGRVSLGIEGVSYDDGMYQGFAIVTVTDAGGWKDTDPETWEYSEDRFGRILRLTLIVAVDGVDVVDYGTLRAELAKHKVGDTVTLTLFHYDREVGEIENYTVEVKLQEQKKN